MVNGNNTVNGRACPGTKAMVRVYCNLIGRRVIVFAGGAPIDGTLRAIESDYLVLTRLGGDYYYFPLDRINWINVPAAQTPRNGGNAQIEFEAMSY